MYVAMYTYLPTWLEGGGSLTYRPTYLPIDICMVCMYVCMYGMYVCMYVCMYVWYGMYIGALGAIPGLCHRLMGLWSFRETSGHLHTIFMAGSGR